MNNLFNFTQENISGTQGVMGSVFGSIKPIFLLMIGLIVGVSVIGFIIDFAGYFMERIKEKLAGEKEIQKTEKGFLKWYKEKVPAIAFKELNPEQKLIAFEEFVKTKEDKVIKLKHLGIEIPEKWIRKARKKEK
jgi:hypothetical protein